MKHFPSRIFMGMAVLAMCLCSLVRAEKAFLDEVSAESFWFAHLDASAVRGTPLEEFLDKMGADGALRDFRKVIAEQLGIAGLKLASTTILDAGEPPGHVVMILRGDFARLKTSTFSVSGAPHRGKTIFEARPWQGKPVYLSQISAVQCVIGTSRRGLERAIGRLDGVGASWQGFASPDGFSNAATVFALDMTKLAEVLDFEADLTQSMQRLWMVARATDGDVEISLALELDDPKHADEMKSQLLTFLPILASIPSEGLAVPKITAEVADGWLTFSMKASPAELATFLNGLGSIFVESDTIKNPRPKE